MIFQLASPSVTHSCGSSSVPLLPTCSCGTDMDQWASIMEEILFLFPKLSSNPSNYNAQVQIPHLRPAEYKRSRLPRNRWTVNRAFGGVLSGVLENMAK